MNKFSQNKVKSLIPENVIHYIKELHHSYIFFFVKLHYSSKKSVGRQLTYNAPFLLRYIYGFTMVLPAMVTPAVLAKALPSRVAPVFNVMDCIAITVPLKTGVVPKVAELPTCQKMLDASAPPLRITLRPEVVVSDDAICIIKTALEFPFASKVRSLVL